MVLKRRKKKEIYEFLMILQQFPKELKMM